MICHMPELLNDQYSLPSVANFFCDVSVAMCPVSVFVLRFLYSQVSLARQVQQIGTEIKRLQQGVCNPQDHSPQTLIHISVRTSDKKLGKQMSFVLYQLRGADWRLDCLDLPENQNYQLNLEWIILVRNITPVGDMLHRMTQAAWALETVTSRVRVAEASQNTDIQKHLNLLQGWALPRALPGSLSLFIQ